jgi:AAA+ superfamily predicted ATPase
VTVTPIPELRAASSERPLVARILLRGRRRVLWLRHLWAESPDQAERWLAISHTEVDRILEGRERLARMEAAFYASDPVCAALEDAVRAADRRVDEDERWQRLRREFELDDPDADLLSLAVAAEIDPALFRLYGYLQDETRPLHATPWVAAAVFQWTPGTGLRQATPLPAWALARPVDPAADPAAPDTEWVADRSIVGWLASAAGLDAGSPEAVHRPARGRADDLGLYPDLLEAMERFARTIRAAPAGGAAPSVELELVGPAGTGKRTLAAQLCARLGTGLLAADVAALGGREQASGPTLDEAVRRVARTARLTASAVYWHGLEGLDRQVEERLHGLVPVAVFGVTSPQPGRPAAGTARQRFRLPALSRAERAQLWRRLAGTPPPAAVTDWALTPAEVARAALVAPAGEAAVLDACQQLLYLGPGELFTPMPRPYTWDDIVLSAPTRRHLEEFEAQARLRWLVYEDWGFERLVPLGRGITAMFAGPSGTGKTMAAQVLARSLGMELYRVDLAGVMNKYIGETEKRLKQVFDSCERANVLLLFDEADALFGQRTQVKDAHDRFANIEIDYLLQRMEQFDGVAVLATNRKGDMDQAFLRRLRFLVDFLPPGPEERRRLWRLVLPDRSPAGDPLLAGDIDWGQLGSRLELSGAGIKSAAIAAAFLARAEGSRIGMEHVMRAAGREMAKHSIELQPSDWGG